MITYIEFRCYSNANNMNKDKRLDAPFCNKWYSEATPGLINYYAMGLCRGLSLQYRRPAVQAFEVIEDNNGKIIKEKLLRTQF